MADSAETNEYGIRAGARAFAQSWVPPASTRVPYIQAGPQVQLESGNRELRSIVRLPISGVPDHGEAAGPRAPTSKGDEDPRNPHVMDRSGVAGWDRAVPQGLGNDDQVPRRLGLIEHTGAGRPGPLVRDWLRRVGRGTNRFLLFGSFQRCRPSGSSV